jgi:choline dehydrogenase-like flavoprotein
MQSDVVIVGAGSAGCLLAGRLSEDPDRAVLLLEAGPDRDDASEAAIAGPDFFAAKAAPGRTWPSLTAVRTPGQGPQPYSRGRGTGGSSAVNGMLAIRGIPADYDRWAAMGAGGWSWEQVQPVFDRLAAQIPLRPPPEPWPVLDGALRRAAAGLGHPWAPDYDEPGVEGVSPAKLTWDGRRRASAAEVFLEPARGRGNLELRPHALVDRVLLDGRRAVGVRLASGEEVEAGEVVVAAGAIHSPAVLLRSGIQRAGMGRGLKDHPSVVATLRLQPEAAGQPGSFPFGSILRWSSGREPADLQLVPLAHLGPEAPPGLGAVMVALMQVRSSGTVTLRSADPADDPAVDLGMLTDEHDLERLARGVRHLVTLLRHPAMASVAASMVMGVDGTEPDALLEPGAAEAWLPANLGDYVHACGTCRMGRADDELAVCDPAGRVHGYDGLRVVDASLFPDLPRANTHLPVLMVAERLATTWPAGP